MFLALFFSTIFALFCLATGAMFSFANDISNPFWHYTVLLVMTIITAFGMWNGYLTLRVQSSHKRTIQNEHDERRQQVFDDLNNWADKTSVNFFYRLLRAPLFIFSFGLLLGTMGAIAVGSFQRYFSPQEFEARQRYELSKR